jgi:hypothetical protein
VNGYAKNTLETVALIYYHSYDVSLAISPGISFWDRDKNAFFFA